LIPDGPKWKPPSTAVSDDAVRVFGSGCTVVPP
jgi:hypothetical protein